MAISFPSSPYSGQSVIVGSKTWVWNGTYWAKSATIGGGTEVVILPSLPGNTGRFLTTDGTDTLWGNVIIPPALPTQTGNSGRFLTTDGTTTNWGNVIIPAVSAAAVSDQTNTSTGYLGIPTGNTAQRPGSPANGASRINSQTNYFETYYNSAWFNLAYLGVYTATGGTVTYSGNYKIHTFLTSSTLNIIDAPPAATIEYLVIAGGGGGGSDMGGGGGAGGYLTASTIFVSGSYTITVGSGGPGGPSGIGSVRGTNGDNSSVVKAGTPSIIAVGGGGGASEYSQGQVAGSGGSGGGASATTGGSTPGTGIIGQGFNGSVGAGNYYPGGGGGAGAAGSVNPGNGGIGLANSILGVSYYWAGGGGGAGYSGIAGNGGLGGGGGGGPKVSGGGLGGGSALNSGLDATVGSLVSQTNVPGGNGGTNTGGGGGGGAHYNANNYGGTGGSGIVIIRYRYQ